MYITPKRVLVAIGIVMGTLFTLFILLIIALLVLIEIPERADEEFLSHSRDVISKELYQYKRQHNQFPDTLAQAAVKERVCYLYLCTKFHYKASEDKQNFALAAARNEFIVFYSTYRKISEDTIEESGLAISEKLNRKDFPIYLKDKYFFATPSVWPTEEELKN